MRRLLLFFLLSLSSAFAQVQITGQGVQIGGTVNPGGGGSTLKGALVIASFSGLYDDGDTIQPPAGSVTSWTQSGTTVAVNTSAAHNLTTSDYVDLSQMPSWPAQQVFGQGSFKVASVPTSTSFTVTYTGTPHTPCASSCGNVFRATDWAFYKTVSEPYFSGVPFAGIETTLANFNTNFTSLMNAATGGLGCGFGGSNPTYLLLVVGENDLASGGTFSGMQPLYQSLWQQAHDAGCVVIGGDFPAAHYGVATTLSATAMLLNQWFTTQTRNDNNYMSGEYIDGLVQYSTRINYASTAVQACSTLPDPGCGAIFASVTAHAFANGFSDVSLAPIIAQNAGDGIMVDTTAMWLFTRPSVCGADGLCPWMTWQGGKMTLASQDTGSVLKEFDSAGQTDGCMDSWGIPSSGTSNNFISRCFHQASPGSTANYAYWLIDKGGSPGFVNLKAFGDGTFQLPAYAGSGLAFACFDALGNFTRSATPCAGGGGGTFDANTVNTPMYATTSGTNAVTATLSPAILSVSNGAHVRVNIGSSNTGAATFSPNGLTAASITKCGTTALAAGDLAAGVVADMTYDGTEWQLVNPQAVGCAGSSGVSSVTATAPLRANGSSGVAQTGAVTVDCPTCGGGGGSSAPFLVNHYGNYSSGNTGTLSSTALTVTVGETVTVGCGANSGASNTVTDSLSNTFTNSSTFGNPQGSISSAVITNAGSDTFTCGGGADQKSINVSIWSGNSGTLVGYGGFSGSAAVPGAHTGISSTGATWDVACFIDNAGGMLYVMSTLDGTPLYGLTGDNGGITGFPKILCGAYVDNAFSSNMVVALTANNENAAAVAVVSFTH